MSGLPDHLPKPPYDESRRGWSYFTGIDLARARVGYHALYIGLYAKWLGISEHDARRQWRQLMYYLSTIHLLWKTGQLLPDNRPLQAPPRLEPLGRIFCEQDRDHLVDYCQTFWEGCDVGWKESYELEHALTPESMHLIQDTAKLIGLPVDDELWQL